jgi:hypothetical protein
LGAGLPLTGVFRLDRLPLAVILNRLKRGIDSGRL